MTLIDLLLYLPESTDITWEVKPQGNHVFLIARIGDRYAMKGFASVHFEQYRELAIQDIVRDLEREVRGS